MRLLIAHIFLCMCMCNVWAYMCVCAYIYVCVCVCVCVPYLTFNCISHYILSLLFSSLIFFSLHFSPLLLFSPLFSYLLILLLFNSDLFPLPFYRPSPHFIIGGWISDNCDNKWLGSFSHHSIPRTPTTTPLTPLISPSLPSLAV